MRDRIEFRIPEDTARAWLDPSVGEVLGGTVRKVVVTPGDEVFKRIGAMDTACRESGRAGFTSWRARRSFTRAELDGAALLLMEIQPPREPAGEECGTEYDGTGACPECGAGRRQLGPLRLRCSRLSRHINRTIADEVAVTDPVVVAVREGGLNGASFLPVEAELGAGQRSIDAAEQFSQLGISSPPIEVVPDGGFGSDPFDVDLAGEFRCSQGHTLGLNRLRPLVVRRDSWAGADFVTGSQLVGVRRGLLVPEQLRLVSQRAFQTLTASGVTGVGWEPVTLA